MFSYLSVFSFFSAFMVNYHRDYEIQKCQENIKVSNIIRYLLESDLWRTEICWKHQNISSPYVAANTILEIKCS